MAALMLAGIAVGGFDFGNSDFLAFYESGRSIVLDHSSSAGRPDLNPPTFALLVAPVMLLPLPVAFALWTVIGIVSAVASMRAITQKVHVSSNTMGWIVIALVGWMPCLSVWAEGQLTWLLLYPVTRAWLASASPLRAGLWLAPVIAIKPPLALFALLLPWRIGLVAGVASAAITVTAILVTGWTPWRDWLALSRAIDWLQYPSNASLIGLAARLEHGAATAVHLNDIHSSWLMAIAMALAMLTLPIVRAPAERRWTLAIVWSTLASPLGWIYYLPLALGPAIASWAPTPATRVAVALLAVPMPMVTLIADTWPGLTTAAACVYGLGCLSCAYAWLDPGRSRRDQLT